jgi:hypothetical protein
MLARYGIFRIVSPAFPNDSLNQWAFGFAPWIRMVIAERVVVESPPLSNTPFLEVQLGRTPQGSLVICRRRRSMVGRGGAARGRTCKWPTGGGTDEMATISRGLPRTSASPYRASSESSETIWRLTQTGISERMCSRMLTASDFATTRSIGEFLPRAYFIVSACWVSRIIGTAGIIRFSS